jgi:hypothetical protein
MARPSSFVMPSAPPGYSLSTLVLFTAGHGEFHGRLTPNESDKMPAAHKQNRKLSRGDSCNSSSY